MRHNNKNTLPFRTGSAATFTSAIALVGLLAGCGTDQPSGGSGGASGSSGGGATSSGGAAGGGGSRNTGGATGTGSGGSGSGGSTGHGGTGAGGTTRGSGGSAAGGSTGAPDAKTADAWPDGPGTDATARQDTSGGTADSGGADGGKDQGGQADLIATSDGTSGSAAVQLVGRFDHLDSTPAKFGWVGSAMIARFNGTGASIQLDGTDDRYAVVVDGTLSSSVLKVTSSGKYQVAKGLAPGVHNVVVWRRSESNWSNASYLGFEVTDGQLVAPPERPSRRLEVYGDSITAGYGLDGAGPSCSMTQDNSNHYLTYAAVAARALSAELHAIAWSGIGMYRNYGESAPKSDSLTMPKVYARIMPATDSAWDFSAWQPQAVVINLGTNDFSTSGDPGAPYETAYLDFVRNLRKKYADAIFVLTIGPMLDGTNLSGVRTHLQSVIKTRASEGDSKMSYLEFPPQVAGDGYGCDWHPSAKTNAKMADQLVAELKKQLSW